jgi:hypothetical protein
VLEQRKLVVQGQRRLALRSRARRTPPAQALRLKKISAQLRQLRLLSSSCFSLLGKSPKRQPVSLGKGFVCGKNP